MKSLVKIVAVVMWCSFLVAYPDDFDRLVNAKRHITIDILYDNHTNISGYTAGLGERIERVFNEFDDKSAQEVGLLWEIDVEDFDDEDSAPFRVTMQGPSTNIMNEIGYFLARTFLKKLKFIPVDTVRSRYASDYYEIIDEYVLCDEMLSTVKFKPDVGEKLVAAIEKGIFCSLESEEIKYLISRLIDSEFTPKLRKYYYELCEIGGQLLRQIKSDRSGCLYNDSAFECAVDRFFCALMNLEVLLKMCNAYSHFNIKRFVLYAGGDHGKAISTYLEKQFNDFVYLPSDQTFDDFCEDVLSPVYLQRKFLEELRFDGAQPIDEGVAAGGHDLESFVAKKRKAVGEPVGEPDAKRKKMMELL